MSKISTALHFKRAQFWSQFIQKEWERTKTKIKQWEIDLIIYFNYELLGGLLFKWVSQFHYYATDFSCEINWRLIYFKYSALKYIDVFKHLNIHLLLVLEIVLMHTQIKLGMILSTKNMYIDFSNERCTNFEMIFLIHINLPTSTCKKNICKCSQKINTLNFFFFVWWIKHNTYSIFTVK